MLKRFRETHTFFRHPAQGCRRATILTQDHYLRLQILRKPTSTGRHLQNQLTRAHEIKICNRTLINRSSEHQLRPRQAAASPRLSRQHRVVTSRLAFGWKHLNWTIYRLVFGQVKIYSINKRSFCKIDIINDPELD